MNKMLTLILTSLFFFPGFAQVHTAFKISDDIEMIKISDNTFIHVSYAELPNFGRFPSNGLLYIDKGKGYLFDTPVNESLTKELTDWIMDSMKIEIIGFVPNHWHEDCMGGLKYLESLGIVSKANQNTIEIAKEKGLPIPTHGFKDSLTLKINQKIIRCYYLGAAHTLDNIVVWIPEECILFAGCMVKELKSKELGNTEDGDLEEYPQTIQKLINKFPAVKIVVPGHGQFGGPQLLQHTRKLAAH